MSGVQHVELPLPPSLNRIWRAGKGGRVYRAPKYMHWLTEAGHALNLARLPHIPGAYDLFIAVPEKMRGDIDNRIKAVSDLLQAHGVIEDDKLAATVTAIRDETVRPGGCRVSIFARRAA